LETSFSGIRVCFFIDMDKPHCDDELQGEEGEEQARLGKSGARVEQGWNERIPSSSQTVVAGKQAWLQQLQSWS
jgi:hypothetical protein